MLGGAALGPLLTHSGHFNYTALPIMRQAAGLRRSRVSGLSRPRPLLQRSALPRSSTSDVNWNWQPGWGWFPDSIRAVARNGSGAYRSAATATSAVSWFMEALADLRRSRHRKERRSTWQESLLARRPTNVILVAMANKTARVVWAKLSRGETFRAEA